MAKYLKTVDGCVKRISPLEGVFNRSLIVSHTWGGQFTTSSPLELAQGIEWEKDSGSWEVSELEYYEQRECIALYELARIRAKLAKCPARPKPSMAEIDAIFGL